MRVGLAQFDIQWETPDVNLEIVRSKVTSDLDLIVFPEMFLTGFSMDPHNIAEKMDGPRIQALQSLADDHGTAIMGSLIVEEEGQLYNRMLLFTPNGTIQSYDKRHLFTFGGEGRNYTAGNTDGIFQLGDWKICARICYDLRFPVWCRNTSEYDLIVFVASWPKTRHHAWLNLVQARAIENQAFSIGVNRTGFDGNELAYLGGSLAVDYNGDVLANANDSNDVMVVELNKQHMLEYRQKLPFLPDQDKFTIHE